MSNTQSLYAPVPARQAYEDMESQRDKALYKLAQERGKVATLQNEMSDLKTRCSWQTFGLVVCGIVSLVEIGLFLLR